MHRRNNSQPEYRPTIAVTWLDGAMYARIGNDYVTWSGNPGDMIEVIGHILKIGYQAGTDEGYRKGRNDAEDDFEALDLHD